MIDFTQIQFGESKSLLHLITVAWVTPYSYINETSHADMDNDFPMMA